MEHLVEDLLDGSNEGKITNNENKITNNQESNTFIDDKISLNTNANVNDVHINANMEEDNSNDGSTKVESLTLEQQQLTILKHPLLPYVLFAINDVGGCQLINKRTYIPKSEEWEKVEDKTYKKYPQVTQFLMNMLKLLEIQKKELAELEKNAISFCKQTSDDLRKMEFALPKGSQKRRAKSVSLGKPSKKTRKTTKNTRKSQQKDPDWK